MQWERVSEAYRSEWEGNGWDLRNGHRLSLNASPHEHLDPKWHTDTAGICITTLTTQNSTGWLPKTERNSQGPSPKRILLAGYQKLHEIPKSQDQKKYPLPALPVCHPSHLTSIPSS